MTLGTYIGALPPSEPRKKTRVPKKQVQPSRRKEVRREQFQDGLAKKAWHRNLQGNKKKRLAYGVRKEASNRSQQTRPGKKRETGPATGFEE